MIFFKKQHEDIATGFLTRIDHLLRQSNKAIFGYSIDKGIETLKLKVGKTIVNMTIEGEMWHHGQEIVPGPITPEPVAEDAKEILY